MSETITTDERAELFYNLLKDTDLINNTKRELPAIARFSGPVSKAIGVTLLAPAAFGVFPSNNSEKAAPSALAAENLQTLEAVSYHGERLVTEEGEEAAEDVAYNREDGSGSCGLYDRGDAIAVAEGKAQPLGDIKDVHVNFLQENPNFNENNTDHARQHKQYMFDALNLGSEATNIDIFSNEHYAQGELINSLGSTQNTRCDNEGNVMNYGGEVTLESGTAVGGLEIVGSHVSSGNTILTLSNGETIVHTSDMLIADVKTLDERTIKMVVSNKLGVKGEYTDKDGSIKEAYVGCINDLSKVEQRVVKHHREKQVQKTVIKEVRVAEHRHAPAPSNVDIRIKKEVNNKVDNSVRINKEINTCVGENVCNIDNDETNIKIIKKKKIINPPQEPPEEPPEEPEIPPKEDDDELPDDEDVPADQDPGTPDVPGEGPADQDEDDEGFVPGENKPPEQDDVIDEDDDHEHPDPVDDLPPAKTGDEPDELNPEGSKDVPNQSNDQDDNQGGETQPGAAPIDENADHSPIPGQNGQDGQGSNGETSDPDPEDDMPEAETGDQTSQSETDVRPDGNDSGIGGETDPSTITVDGSPESGSSSQMVIEEDEDEEENSPVFTEEQGGSNGSDGSSQKTESDPEDNAPAAITGLGESQGSEEEEENSPVFNGGQGGSNGSHETESDPEDNAPAAKTGLDEPKESQQPAALEMDSSEPEDSDADEEEQTNSGIGSIDPGNV